MRLGIDLRASSAFAASLFTPRSWRRVAPSHPRCRFGKVRAAMHEVHRQRRHENRDADDGALLVLADIPASAPRRASRDRAPGCASSPGSGPVQRNTSAMSWRSSRRISSAGRPRLGRRRPASLASQVVEDGPQVAIQAGGAGLGRPADMSRSSPRARSASSLTSSSCSVGRHERLARADRSAACDRSTRAWRAPSASSRVVGAPVAPGVIHTANVSAQSSSGCFCAYQPGRWRTNRRLNGCGRYSSRYGCVIEPNSLHPLLVVVELVGVVHDVAHLVPQVAQDVVPVEALDVADLLAVQLRELGPREVERNGDRRPCRTARPTPSTGRSAASPRDAELRELRAKLLDDAARAACPRS